jgi:hypothetical protein
MTSDAAEVLYKYILSEKVLILCYSEHLST